MQTPSRAATLGNAGASTLSTPLQFRFNSLTTNDNRVGHFTGVNASLDPRASKANIFTQLGR